MTTKVNDPVAAFMRAIRDMLRDPSSGDYNFGVAREGLRKADAAGLAKAADYINIFVAEAGADADGQRADRFDDAPRSPHDNFLAGAGEGAALWKSAAQRALDARGDGAATPQESFTRATQDMWKTERMRAEGWD